ncbi:MAG: dihydrodipicolinate synthase family protein [Alphaproteobacteria bacterium]
MRFEGIIPPVITPFHDDGSVDKAGYATVIEYMIESGVHAIIAGGTTGEFYALSPDERVGQFKHAKDIINGRVPLICGVNDLTTDGACAFAVAARDAGADGILVAAPYYSLPTEHELASHCLAIDRAAKLPIILYNYPGRTGANMGREFLERVGQSANFQCIKESSGDINRLHLLAHEFPHIALSCGAEDQALEFFVWGATSWVTPMGNFFAPEVVAFYEACVTEKDFTKARRLMSALLPLTTTLESGGKFVQCVKYACEMYGLPAGPVRKPMQPMNKKLGRETHEVLVKAKTAIQHILSADTATEAERVAPARLVDQG